jgi:predicted metal-dependent phosphoesterase TrpH
LRVDFHTHTGYSPDSIASIARFLKSAHLHGLDRVVVTDHNTIRGALAAQKAEPEFVIVGEEIQTTCGELLAAFVKEEVPKNLDPMKAIELLRAQGAFISVSHPMDYMRSGWPDEDLKRIIPFVDAIEGANARVLKNATNTMALVFAREHDLAITAGSDAHHPYELGRMSLELPAFTDADSLRSVIRAGRVVGMRSPGWVHLFSTQARIVKKFRSTGNLG